MARYIISDRLQLTRLFREFYESEKAGRIVLLFCTVISLIIANSVLSDGYSELLHHKIGLLSAEHWINDGLMAIFFLLIGLELEREIYQGGLSILKNALLPVAAALGRIIVPAGIYIVFNFGTSTQTGAGFLAGIGFTMSIFITPLAFNDPVIINNAKLMILIGSLVAGTTGFLILKSILKEEISDDIA